MAFKKETLELDNTEVNLKSPLMAKKVVIELIKKRATSLYRDADEATLLTGAKKTFALPTDNYGNLTNPLTKEEQTYLENLLGIDLNVYTIHNPTQGKLNYWKTKQAVIKLHKISKEVSSASITLDLSNPQDFILYKIALVNPRIAKEWGKRYDNAEYEAVIKDPEAEFVEHKIEIDKEDIVIEYLFKNKQNKKKLFDLVRLFGQEFITSEMSINNSAEYMYTHLREASKEKNKLSKLYNIIKLSEKDISDKVLLADAVSAGLIEKQGWEYRLSGGQKIGTNENEAVDWLNNPVNSGTKILLAEGVDKWYKSVK